MVALDNGPLPDVHKKYRQIPSKLLTPLQNALKKIETDLRKIGKKRGLGLDDPDDDEKRENLERAIRISSID